MEERIHGTDGLIWKGMGIKMTRNRLFCDGWQFLWQPLGSTIEQVKEKEFVSVNIPHDWQIYHADRLYEDGIGWYRKVFQLDKDADTCYEIYFEGIYMDSLIYVNGQQVGEWKYGYSSFFIDLTEQLVDGENEIVVRVQYQSPNTRWYSGAGIYRNVYWKESPAIHIATDSAYVVSRPTDETLAQWTVEASVDVVAPKGDTIKEMDLQIQILDMDENLLATEKKTCVSGKWEIATQVSKPKLWSIESPNLYWCVLSLYQDNQKLDEVKIRIGFRSFTFDTEKGFFLNGVHTKLNGVCEHHDFGALGAVFSKVAMRRKMRILREMGVNAIRSTHNMPAVDLLELADELGFLVVNEAFDMWERPKTTYDYARFFPEWYQKDVKSWVCRDRNHACVLMWSIGNEIYDTHADERGQVITKQLMDEVLKYDPKGNAKITIGSNFMPWENARKCADIVKFAGYNYAEKYYREHHEEHPDWYIYGSETSSTVQSRGIYHFPYKQSVLADDDEQCSALGNSTTSWGAKSTESCIIAERDHEFSMGQFLWSGFDYIGEPTPYHTRNSYFGQIDTAGFPKDSYYIYQSAWSEQKKPMIHVFPYWDFNPGQIVDVRVATNAPIVELFLNGRSLGECQIDHEKGMVLTGNWQVPYEDGELTAVAYDEQHQELIRETKHSFGNPVTLIIEQDEPDRALVAGIGDVAFFTVYAVDENGYPVENANNMIWCNVSGAGWLTGVDNGDSTDTDEYKGHQKRLFSGKMLVMAAVGADTGEIRIEVNSQGLEGATITVPVTEKEIVEGISLIPEKLAEKTQEQMWVRKITLQTSGETKENGLHFTEQVREKFVTVEIEPAEAVKVVKPTDLIWKVVNDAGIECTSAKVEPAEDAYQAKVTALGDGAFRLRCMIKNGTDKVKVISQIECEAQGLGPAFLNPYDFIAGGLYTYAEGDAGNGNEHGVSTARDGRTVVAFEHVDFGTVGSDLITMPIFELGGDRCPIEIWEGIPGQEGSTLLADVVYHKPSIWNVYQEETYQLTRKVTGVSTISFVLNQKIHLKGFSFAKKEKAWEKLFAVQKDAIYGDQYRVEADAVYDIGNNVTLEFTEMDFGDKACNRVTICGKTQNDINTMHICFADDAGETRQIVEFSKSDDWKEMSFELAPMSGKKTIRFIFLPGSQFDFKWFQFQ